MGHLPLGFSFLVELTNKQRETKAKLTHKSSFVIKKSLKNHFKVQRLEWSSLLLFG